MDATKGSPANHRPTFNIPPWRNGGLMTNNSFEITGMIDNGEEWQSNNTVEDPDYTDCVDTSEVTEYEDD